MLKMSSAAEKKWNYNYRRNQTIVQTKLPTYGHKRNPYANSSLGSLRQGLNECRRRTVLNDLVEWALLPNLRTYQRQFCLILLWDTISFTYSFCPARTTRNSFAKCRRAYVARRRVTGRRSCAAVCRSRLSIARVPVSRHLFPNFFTNYYAIITERIYGVIICISSFKNISLRYFFLYFFLIIKFLLCTV